jgi:hypothetical protein
MAFSLLNIFFLLTGVIGIQVLQAIGLHMDALSFVWLLLNFSVSGRRGRMRRLLSGCCSNSR